MAAHGARRLGRMNRNLSMILSVEFLCAAQSVEFREPLRTSPALRDVLAAIRARVPRLDEDRFLAPDLAEMNTLVRDAALSRAAGLPESVDGVAA
jgi:histidine ammonia-lyase